MARPVFTKKRIEWASKVSRFMQTLHLVDRTRYQDATQRIPFGDMAYGQALQHWHNNGKPSNAFFSYARGQVECPLLLAFKEEISKEFGLPILTIEEGEKRAAAMRTKTKKVYDWGLN